MTSLDRAALTDALTAASAGPNPPPIARLRAATEYVIEHAEPDQVILFGSAARGEFRPGSDFDFLVVRRPRTANTRATDSARWTHPETGDRMDVLFERPDLAAERRWRLGTPHSVIFADGATIHVAPFATPIPTLRDEGRTRADMTSPKSKWDPSEAAELIADARQYLRHADTDAEDERWGMACKQAQESAERSLKSVIVAADRFRPTAAALLEYAGKRVRARLAEYERTRKTDRPRPLTPISRRGPACCGSTRIASGRRAAPRRRCSAASARPPAPGAGRPGAA